MNVYYVEAGEREYTEFSEDGYSAKGYGYFGDYVTAETRGQARAQAIRSWKDMFSVRLEWTDKISVKKVGTCDYYGNCLIYPYYDRVAVNWTIPNPPQHYEDIEKQLESDPQS